MKLFLINKIFFFIRNMESVLLRTITICEVNNIIADKFGYKKSAISYTQLEHRLKNVVIYELVGRKIKMRTREEEGME